jgi:Fe2+ transport system protein FeoA
VSEFAEHEAAGRALPGDATPLSLACGRKRLKVCRINGDRKLCARMAQLGVLPGSEIEMICPGRSKQCMVRVMGSTVTLDPLCAEQILVTPL